MGCGLGIQEINWSAHSKALGVPVSSVIQRCEKTLQALQVGFLWVLQHACFLVNLNVPHCYGSQHLTPVQGQYLQGYCMGQGCCMWGDTFERKHVESTAGLASCSAVAVSHCRFQCRPGTLGSPRVLAQYNWELVDDMIEKELKEMLEICHIWRLAVPHYSRKEWVHWYTKDLIVELINWI